MPDPTIAQPASLPPPITPFHVLRHEDVHGNTGTGIVAQGVIFSTGKCVLQWLHEIASIATFDSLSDLEAIHGHSGKTVVVIDR